MKGGTSRCVKLMKKRWPSSSGISVFADADTLCLGAWNFVIKAAVVLSQGNPR
jgi:hypothetical protein